MHVKDQPISTWLAGALGQALLEQERLVVTEAMEQVFGVQALQVGAWGPPGVFLESARTQRRALIATGSAAGAGVRSHAGSLAVQGDSVDALLLPHTLEFELDPHAVLREAERVLVGEGHLIVLGFEPLGSWSLRHRVTRDGFPPGLERTLSERRLRDWLSLLAFEVLEVRRYLYAPPIARLQAGRTHDAIVRAGRRFWPRLSGAYLLKARKRVYCMTPVRMRMRMRRSVVTGLASPATPVGNGLGRRAGAAHLTVVPDPPR